jgi:hypothetical protein
MSGRKCCEWCGLAECGQTSQEFGKVKRWDVTVGLWIGSWDETSGIGVRNILSGFDR